MHMGQPKKIPLKIVIKNDEKELLPFYATEDSAGADLKANIENSIDLEPNKSVLIPTGLFLEIPKGFEVQIRPRSGLALNHQITVLNTPGTIDADYRGEVKIILINHSSKIFTIKCKMKIAQMILCPIYQAEFLTCEKLAVSNRGGKGFGHSGSY